jgi:hypothetical protein
MRIFERLFNLRNDYVRLFICKTKTKFFLTKPNNTFAAPQIFNMDIKYTKHIAADLNLSVKQIGSVYQMHTEGATIPFIARYRKEATWQSG